MSKLALNIPDFQYIGKQKTISLHLKRQNRVKNVLASKTRTIRIVNIKILIHKRSIISTSNFISVNY